MIKKIAAVLMLYTTCHACPEALPAYDANFCPSFKAAAICHCTASGLPYGICKDVGNVYRRMVSFFGSLERACQHQTHTSAQTCIDNWNCYLNGGIDSSGRACSNNNKACGLA